MKLTTTKAKISQAVGVPGLVTGQIDYEIKGGESNATWAGPKIPAAVWNEILTFFQDTYNSSKSECQVRLYVNTVKKTWDAWAYPQEARSFMTAKEIDNPAAAKQREQFKESDGWFYLGTVHHHCAGSAFQSGTDLHNEKSQDGLHITVGKMDEARYDMHARFYLSGCEFTPDLAEFWDVGEEVRKMIPPNLWDSAARYQMTAKVAPDSKYPKAWHDNLIEIKTAVTPTPTELNHNPAVTPRQVSLPVTTGNGSQGEILALSVIKRRELALAEVKRDAGTEKFKPRHVEACFRYLLREPVVDLIRKTAAKFRLSITDIVNEWDWEQSLNSQASRKGTPLPATSKSQLP